MENATSVVIVPAIIAVKWGDEKEPQETGPQEIKIEAFSDVAATSGYGTRELDPVENRYPITMSLGDSTPFDFSSVRIEFKAPQIAADFAISGLFFLAKS